MRLALTSGSPTPRFFEKLGPLAKDAELQKKWRAAKQERKELCAKMVEETTGVKVSTDALFDIQIKRIHEYKRQLLNIMGIIHRYNEMKAMTPEERAKVTPRVCLFGGKAYATYLQAKRIVRLVTAVGDVVNNDPEIGDLLKVVFVPDYNVSSPRPSSPPPSSPSTSPPRVPRPPAPPT